MKEEELKRLTERYYSGESTEEEESLLREFFREGVIPDGYEAEKIIFGYYSESADIPEPSIGFEDQLLAGIDAAERNRKTMKIRKIVVSVLSTAAALLLLAGSYFFFKTKAEPSDTFKDPVIAYAETIKILRDVSSMINRGAQVLEPVGKMNEVSHRTFNSINKSTRIVEKILKSLNYLEKETDNSENHVEKKINK